MKYLILSIDQMRFLTHNLKISNKNASVKWVPQYTDKGEFIEYTIEPLYDLKPNEIPTFTITDMLSLLPKWQLSIVTGGYELKIFPPNWSSKEFFPKTVDKSIVKTVYRMICLAKYKSLI